jgi:transporter family protein
VVGSCRPRSGGIAATGQPKHNSQCEETLRFQKFSAVSPKLIISYDFLYNDSLHPKGKIMTWFIWALLSAFFAGLTAILAKVGVENVNSNLATAIRTVVILVFAWSVALLTKTQSLSSIGKRTWIFLVLSGIATGLSWLCYFRALQLGEASQVAPVDKLSVVIAIALAAIFLHEHLTWHHYLGGILIVSGAIVLAYAR